MFLDKYFIAIILLIFCFCNFYYIHQRYKEKQILCNNKNKIPNNDNGNNNNNNNFFFHYDTNDWIKKNENLIYSIDDSDYNIVDDGKSISNKITTCKGIIVEIDRDKLNCNDLSRDLCDGQIILRKFTVPLNSKIDFYSHSGYKLIKGQSYCIYKPPPIDDGSSNDCNETWGFWKYSLKYNMWRCKSKVPGVYNEETNSFDPCSKGNGHLYYNNHYLPNQYISRNFNPEQFFSLKFQKKFKCDCPRGYISRPDLSRTTCFKDPCLINLPPYSEAAGYDVKTGNCNCGPYFKNLYPDNLKSPCTMCPDAPVWDYRNNNLIIYVKCGENDKFKCISEEDKLRGCIKTKLKVKPIYVNELKKSNFNDITFF